MWRRRPCTSLMNLLNLKRTHLQQHPKGSSAWNMPLCAEVPQSSVIIHSVFNGFTNTTSIFQPSIDADDDDDDGNDDDDDDDDEDYDYYDDGDNDDEDYDDDHNNSNC